jgi:hypothetical protein
MADDKIGKTEAVVLWIKEYFPFAHVANQGNTHDTEVWLLISEGELQAELDLNRRGYLPPAPPTDWFFSHANARRSGDEAPRVLIKANISDPEYFDKLRQALEAGGLTYRERQT